MKYEDSGVTNQVAPTTPAKAMAAVAPKPVVSTKPAPVAKPAPRLDGDSKAFV